MHQCGAKTRAGIPCKTAAMPNGRCRMHGGKTPSGPALPQYIDGRHSKVLPKRLIDGYQASVADPDKLVLNAEIGLIDTRIQDVLKRVDTGESGQLWSMLRQAASEYELARKANDTPALVAAITLLIDLVKRGHTDAAAWSELGGWIERRRKLVESERKRLIEAQQMIHVEQAMGLLGLMVDAVRRHVDDESTLGAIVNEYSQLVGRPVPMEAPPAIPARSTVRRGAG